MKKKNGFIIGRVNLLLVFLSVIILFIANGCKDTVNLEDVSPGWLGTSIYDNLNNDGHFTYTTKLIEDLDYKNVLAKTGSKTLFVTDDESFDRFFSHNDWGVHSYDALSLAQKKLLFKGAMINNSYQLNTLSSTEGPTEGNCMRRTTALTVYDSVPILSPSEMPDSKYWARFKNAGKSIVCMKDMTVQPMVHFLEKQLANNNITNDDVDFLNNYSSQRQPGDATINGVNVIGKNIKCSNGFVNQMEEVMLPLRNMAEVIRTKETTSKYSKLLERYCAPYYSADATKEYNRLFKTSVDSVYLKRYFSNRSVGGTALTMTPDNKAVNGILKFDPGWNSYFPATAVSTTSAIALQQDMSVMMVPSNAAMDNYWNNGLGRILKDYYGAWEKVPDNVIAKLINVNMLNSFKSSVPSKFESILDDATNPMGITVDDVDSVYLGCNGAIYLTNKVFSPTAYISVSFPALVDQSMNIAYWAIERLQYDAYLNARETYYSLFIPRNQALAKYIDPVSYGRSTTQIFKFYYDPEAVTVQQKVKASIWSYDAVNDQILDSIGMATYDQIINRLEDVLESHTVIGDVEDGNTYYRTKGGEQIKVSNVSGGENNMKVSGSYQLDNNRDLRVGKIYTQGNGKTYILDNEPLMTTKKSVFDVLSEHEEFSKFMELLNGTQFLTNLQNNHSNPSQHNINFFSKFHYTVYVPTNKAITDLQESGKLPTWDEVDGLMATDSVAAEKKAEIIRNFVKYHIQDNAVFADKNTLNGNFETAVLNNALKVFYSIDVKSGNNAITLTDKVGNVRHVTSDPNLRNLIAREYQFDAADVSRATKIFSSANIVIHQIDGALQYDAKQFK